MKKLLLVLMLAFHTSGCGLIIGSIRAGNEDKKMRSWVGRDIEAVTSAWGVPSKHMGRVWEWDWNGGVQAYADAYGNVTAYQNTCREWFNVDSDGTIIGWHWQGQC